jgi:hypothetical protein
MKIRLSLTINGKLYPAGSEISAWKIYPFFLFHMALFGGSGFLMAYGATKAATAFLFLHGGLALSIYTVFYISIFGLDEVKWMFINAAIGLFGIYLQIGWILSFFGKEISSYPLIVHVIPFLYFVFYTFLLRQMVLDITGARGEPERTRKIDTLYLISWALFDGALYFFWR